MPHFDHHLIPKRKTKIVATLGPASSSPEIIQEMIKAGMNVARLNFSHGTHDEHERLLLLVREQAKLLNTNVAVFQDLCGPKIRINNVVGDSIVLLNGATITLAHDKSAVGNSQTLYISIFDPKEVLKSGETAFLADGRIELVVDKITEDGAVCKVVFGGNLRSRSGISLPQSKLQLPILTAKDLLDLRWGLEHDIDFVAVSFVSSVKDILTAREEMSKVGKAVGVIAKFERARSLDNVESIIEACDAAMVARGDLGLELPIEKVPGAQKLIIETANHHGVPVITATQMLVSMVNEIKPTRAEVSDIWTAVRDGTDAVMLSEETALGKYPIEAIKVLDRTLQEAEKQIRLGDEYRPKLKSAEISKISDSICYAAAGAAEKLSASAILACTVTGRTARLMAKYRPRQIIFAPTTNKKTLRIMTLFWGVEPIFIELNDQSETEDEVVQAMIAVRDVYGLKPGARVVITAGLRAKKTGATNIMEIREIPRG